MKRGLGLGSSVFVLAMACSDPGYFVCRQDGECGGGSGICEAVGACSFPDDACPSGRRYGEASTPSVAGECVGLDDGGAIESSTDEEPQGSTSSANTVTGDLPDSSDTGGPIADGTTGGGCPADWWDCEWSSRHRISLAQPLSETLDDFTVLVLLGPPRVDYSRMQVDGEDLRFVSDTGVELPFEVERWAPGDVSILWVRVDALGGAHDHFHLYYGNPAAEHVADSVPVWPSPRAGVWHLGEDLRDATANAIDGTRQGTVTTTSGQVGDAQSFESSSARVTTDAPPALADVFVGGATVSAWMRPHGAGGGTFGRIVQKQTTGIGWAFFVGNNRTLRFAYSYPEGSITWGTTSGAYALDTWIHAAVQFDATSQEPPRFWVDGVEVLASDPDEVPASRVASDVDVPAIIGNRENNDRAFDGILDEIRVERTLRSETWLKTEVASMRDELLEFGAREELAR